MLRAAQTKCPQSTLHKMMIRLEASLATQAITWRATLGCSHMQQTSTALAATTAQLQALQ